jgi:hypothetical protein
MLGKSWFSSEVRVVTVPAAARALQRRTTESPIWIVAGGSAPIRRRACRKISGSGLLATTTGDSTTAATRGREEGLSEHTPARSSLAWRSVPNHWIRMVAGAWLRRLIRKTLKRAGVLPPVTPLLPDVEEWKLEVVDRV